ncbi:TRAP transporter small permease [Primorskyibacter sp. S187A]|uniref:TRAP transporter small permease n=1 Tax=Primorskyibacter sp. S187A TaxID=3415130 RepID=UPI003C7DC884
MFESMRRVAQTMAIVGGVVLSSLVVLVCLSILGRELGAAFPASGLAPITGDFELVEAGMAFAIFCFLPLCQIEQGHAVVDVFTSKFGPRLQRALIWVSDILFAAVLVLIAVQLGAGTLSKMNSGQTTFLLQFPIWWAYALSFVGAGVAALVACVMAVLRSLEITTGQSLIPASDQGAQH